jgi:hypothetical protein
MTRAPLRSIALALALATSGAASAHELDEGTARITLRDDHVDVVAEWDLFLLVDATPTALATGTDAEVAAAHTRVREAIERDTRLRVDGRPIALTLTGFASAAEFRAIAATLSAAGNLHGARVRMRLEARQPVPGASHITLAAPPRVGAVLVSFVQPASHYARPGDTATFEVLAPRHAPAASAPTTTAPAPARQGLGTLPLILLWTLASLAAWRWTSQRPHTPLAE